MNEYAIVDANGNVINVAMWDGTTPWTPAGGTAVLIPAGSEASIGWTYAAGSFVAPAAAVARTPAQLTHYAISKQSGLEVGGYTKTLSGVAVNFQTDPLALTTLVGDAVRQQIARAPSQVLVQSDQTTVVAVNDRGFVEGFAAVVDFIQASLAPLQTVLAGINDGSITTIDEIDAAAWPPNQG